MSQMQPQRKTLDLNHIQMSYLEWNEGQKPLLLLHGLGDHALVWLSLGNHLAQEYHIVAPDLRGHGDSAKPPQGYTFAEIIADLQALVQHLGWSQAHILGHSWTGKLVPIWATKYPEQFLSMILVDPFFIGTMPSWFKVIFPLLYQVLPFLKTMGTFASYTQAEAQAKKLKQYRGWTNLQQQVFRASITQQPDGSWSAKFVSQARDEVFEEVMQVAGLTQQIKIPTLFIKPETGLNRTAWQLKPYQTYLTNLQIEETPGNHWAFLVAPDAFNQTVEAFLTKL